MTPEEKQLTQGFLQQLDAVRGLAKDPEADAMIREAVARQPDAAYLLVQRSLLMNQALDTAKQEIAQLQAQLAEKSQAASSFLGSGWGRAPAVAPAPAPAPNVLDVPSRPVEEPQAARSWKQRLFGGAQPAPAAPAAAPSFLGSAMSTAAGVAGGMFLFNGIESLLHHGTGTAGADAAAAATPQPTEQITNNYYGDSGSGAAAGSSTSADQGAADTGNDSWDTSSADDGFFGDGGSDDI